MKIAFFELEDWERAPLEKAFAGHELKLYQEKLQDKLEEVKDFEIISVFIYSEVTKASLEKVSNLKMIATRSTGYDHIDLVAAKERGVTICNVPHYGRSSVAEHAFALILALARNLLPAVERTKDGKFGLVEELKAFELKGKTIGIVGCGDIGKKVALIAKGFEMKILVYDVKKDRALAKRLGFSYVAYEHLLARSDVITFHVPLLPQTRHMLNQDNIKKVKKGAIIINTARGEVIETEALYYGLEKGLLGGVGLDVLEEECTLKEEKQLLSKQYLKTCDLVAILQEHILLHKDNVIITPHSAFYSSEALQRILDTTCENIFEFIKGKPVNQVPVRKN